MRGYRTVRTVSHSLLSELSRNWLHDRSPAPVKSVKRRIVAAFEKDADHDAIYDDAYYGKFVEPTAQISASAMSNSIVGDLSPRHVIDVGCGTGNLLCEIRRPGIDVFRLELADAQSRGA